ncbi:hypothetical protein CSA56_18010 [candidate division KSB3 bacterium]|uniref:Radical SAM core domain-containing protein n=1 Tax=candidate division KSB3 bacterium TaxID=2044937 RepID=A0A2G6K768_9BACT|nr:MAG: hypothetical protein CSA56_18010 [candidate division KSB3 bacterium]
MISYINTLANVLHKPLTMRQLPLHMQIEHTTYCNLDCIMCDRSKCIQTPQHLAFEKIARVLEEVRPAKISLSGNGEPLMHPDMLSIIRTAKAQGCSVNTTTNGTLLNTQRCQELVESGLDLIKISIDGATRETYRKIRGQDKFLHVVDGIRALVDAKKRANSSTPFIRLNYVMTKDTYREIPMVVELAAKWEIDGIFFQLLDLVGIEERKKSLIGDLTYEDFSHELTCALAISQSLPITTNLAAIYKELGASWKKYQFIAPYQGKQRICILPWFQTYISVEGDVRPCCYFKYGQYGTMGTIAQATMQEIWNGEAYQRLREAFRQGKRLYPVCQHCMARTLGDIVGNMKFIRGWKS